MDESLICGERRAQPRIEVGNRTAVVDFCDGLEEMTVCVWDVSAKGACLLVPPDLNIPNTFKIKIDDWRKVTVVWRRWSHVGIQFLP